MSQTIKTNKADLVETKNSIYFVGGEKGGVGKSFFTRCLVDYFIVKGWKDKFVLIEADPTIKDVGCVFKDNSQEVRFSDNKLALHEPNVIFETIQKKNSVVNLPSNVMSFFDPWIERYEVLSLKEKYCQEMVYFFVSDGCWRSMELFMRQVKHYDTQKFPHVLVFNTARLTNYNGFDSLIKLCPELIKLLKDKQIPILYLPELDSFVQFACDRANLSYTELKNKPEKELTAHFAEQIKKNGISSDLLNSDEREELQKELSRKIHSIALLKMVRYNSRSEQTNYEYL